MTCIIKRALVFVGLLLSTLTTFATIFGTVTGLIHDPQHRPVQGAQVTLRAASSDWTKTVSSDDAGEFRFDTVPLGEYTVRVELAGFASEEQKLVLSSGREARTHFSLTVAQAKETIEVKEKPVEINPEASSSTTLVTRRQIAEAPGADRTNSLQMITDFVPGAYYTHDQLHIRGGHQVSWLIDGVPVPNTNIASNIGPQFDPKDIDYLEIQRGSYDAAYGDRTYGIFNIVPRSGFERDNEAELVTSFGNSYQTNDQLSFGGHTQRFAYFASLNGNRSNLGLQTPIGQVFHDAENGYGGFGTFIYNLNPKDQFRLVTSLRADYYQVPYDPNPSSPFDSSGLRDGQHENDGYASFSWVRTINPNMLLTVSPFFHHNTANYQGAPADTPQSATDNRTSNYGGLQTTFTASVARNNIEAGVYGFGQHDQEFFGLIFNDGSANPSILSPETATGGLVAGFLSDSFKPTSWLTLIAGMRPTHFSSSGSNAQAGVSENTINPRFGIALQVPHLNWVFRAFYGHYYQAPPLTTISGPLLEFIQSGSQLSFDSLHGERDEEHQFGVTIPFTCWTPDYQRFQDEPKNFFECHT